MPSEFFPLTAELVTALYQRFVVLAQEHPHGLEIQLSPEQWHQMQQLIPEIAHPIVIPEYVPSVFFHWDYIMGALELQVLHGQNNTASLLLHIEPEDDRKFEEFINQYIAEHKPVNQQEHFLLQHTPLPAHAVSLPAPEILWNDIDTYPAPIPRPH